MNDDPLGFVAARAANRRRKSCKFKRAMLKRLVLHRYDLNAPPRQIGGGAWTIVARVNDNVQWPEEE
jgi:hypothetical protein